MPDSTYTDQDIAAILKRAAELQAGAERTAELRPGLTLKELEDIAAEAGLDPRFVQQAAAEQKGARHLSPRRQAQRTATHVYAERHVPGTLTDESWEDTVLELRHRFDTDLGVMMGGAPPYGQSTTESFGRSREWRHMNLWGLETRVMLRPREDAVDIRLSRRVGLAGPTAEAAMYGLCAALLAGFAAGGGTGSAIIGFLTFFIAWIVAFPVIRHLDLAWRAQKHTNLEDLADTVVRLAVVPAEQSSAADPVQAPASTGTADLLRARPLSEEETPARNDAPTDTRTRSRTR